MGGGTESISPYSLEFISALIRESVQEKCSQMNIPYLTSKPVIQKKSNFFLIWVPGDCLLSELH